MRHFLWIFLLVTLVIRFIVTTPNYKNGERLKITGQLFTEPNISGKYVSFNLSGVNVLMTTNDNIHYGDRVVVEGVYKDGKVVDAKLDKLIVSDNFFVKIRKRLTDFYFNNLNSREAGLVAGVTLGTKSNISRNFGDKLKATGTSHVIVASGMNVTLVSEFILSLLLVFIGRKKAVAIGILFIWFYAFVTGLEAPIVRAAIMASVMFAAQIFGRVANTFRVTLLTGLAMLIIVPRWVGDVGFLLSFATTISLVLFQAKVGSLIRFVPEFFREDLATSIAAQIASGPIIFYYFGNYNLLSPIINALVLWTVPLMMIIAGIAGVISFISLPLGRVILAGTYPLTAWFIAVINFFS